MPIGIISLTVQWEVAHVMSLSHFSFFSYGTMAEKAAKIVGCQKQWGWSVGYLQDASMIVPTDVRVGGARSMHQLHAFVSLLCDWLFV